MKLQTTIKTLCAALALAGATAASATPFYLDPGTDYSSASGQACATCTSVKTEALYTYDSTTNIFDIDGNGIDAGDGLTTSAGLAVGSLSTNRVTGFNPGETFGADSDNGYGTSNWLISFSMTNLNGVVTGVSSGVPLFAYGPGLLELFITFNGTTFNNFMDIAISGGGATGVSTVLFGKADFTSVDAGYNNLFHDATGATCNGSNGFYDMWLNCGPSSGQEMVINFEASQDTNILISDFDLIPGVPGQRPDVWTVTSNHDGSLTPQVPEPASIALMGLGLLGLGAMRRRKSV